MQRPIITHHHDLIKKSVNGRSQLRQLLETDTPAEYTDPRPGDIKHSLADITRAKELLGFEPRIDFEQGLRLAIDWYKANL